MTGLVGLPRKKSRTSRLKSAVRSIIDQCPQCENTDRSALSMQSLQLERGLQRNDLVLPAVHDQGAVRQLPGSSSSGVHMASTQRCRGAGNIDENDSWKPGSMLAS